MAMARDDWWDYSETTSSLVWTHFPISPAPTFVLVWVTIEASDNGEDGEDMTKVRMRPSSCTYGGTPCSLLSGTETIRSNNIDFWPWFHNGGWIGCFALQISTQTGDEEVIVNADVGGTGVQAIHAVSTTLTGGGVVVDAQAEAEEVRGTSSTLTMTGGDDDAIVLDSKMMALPGETFNQDNWWFNTIRTPFKGQTAAGTVGFPVDMTWTQTQDTWMLHNAVTLVDAAEGIVDGDDPPDPEPGPGGQGGGGGYTTGVSFPTSGVKGMFFPEPYYTTKTGVALAQQLNRLRIY